MNELQSIPWSLIAPLLIVQLILIIVAIVDIIKIHETRGPKWMWILISIFCSMLGPIAYFIIGRKNV